MGHIGLRPLSIWSIHEDLSFPSRPFLVILSLIISLPPFFLSSVSRTICWTLSLLGFSCDSPVVLLCFACRLFITPHCCKVSEILALLFLTSGNSSRPSCFFRITSCGCRAFCTSGDANLMYFQILLVHCFCSLHKAFCFPS